MRDLEPVSGSLKTKMVLGVIGMVVGALWGFTWAVNHLGGYHG